MSTAWIIFIVFCSCVFSCAPFAFLLFRASKRLLEFDELFEFLYDGVETNVKYFAKLSQTATFSNSTEIQTAQKNMKIMAIRMNEYAMRLEETSGRSLRKIADPPGPRPVSA